MPKRMFVLGVAFFALAIFSATRCAAKANAEDVIVDHFFSAIRDGNFKAATSHFSAKMKALSPAGLKGSWNQVYASQGRLRSWKIFERQSLPKGGDEFRVQLRFSRATANSIIVVAAQTGEIKSVLFKLPATAPPYSDQTRFHFEDVTVGAYKLPGTLTIPKGKGPFPAVVLIEGSGPNDRDETVGANHPFADIAQGLSSRGIVVLRYDKRTYAYPQLDPQKTTVDEEVIRDGVAAVGLLRARRDVEQDRIVLVGHSLGAMLAPEIAKQAWPIAGIVMLAPSGRKLEQAIVQQARFSAQTAPGQLPVVERQADDISAHKMPPTQMFFGAPASYYYNLDARNEFAIARSLNLPILILHGSRDYQVLDKDIGDWQNGLKGDPKVRVDTFPGLNHLFIAGAGKPGPAEYATPGHVDAAVIATIASFVANAGRAPASRAAAN
ncbi:alpha/beta fold hydrolase [Candidatus Binatus sp.]|uniref:alpha/beta fold hydrolase n=1 Tax=Candidatus Binatus sp. TaxID=2811406 RepID=UPI003F95B717